MKHLNERHPAVWKLGPQIALLPLPTSQMVSITLGPDIEMHHRDWASNQLRTLVERGITHIIDIRIEVNDEDDLLDLWEEEWPDNPSPEYLHIPMDDDGGKVGSYIWEKVRTIAKNLVESDREAHLYIHCHMGVNRGPSFGLALAYEYVNEVLGKPGYSRLIELLDSRPDAAAIYFPQYIRWSGHSTERSDVAEALVMIGERRKSLKSTVHRKRLEEAS